MKDIPPHRGSKVALQIPETQIVLQPFLTRSEMSLPRRADDARPVKKWNTQLIPINNESGWSFTLGSCRPSTSLPGICHACLAPRNSPRDWPGIVSGALQP